MADGMLSLARRFVQPRQVVMAVGEVRILGNGGVVGLESRLLLSQILERDTQVEEQQGIGRAVLERTSVDFLGGPSVPTLVQQPAPVDPGRREPRGGLCRARVRSERRGGVAA